MIGPPPNPPPFPSPPLSRSGVAQTNRQLFEARTVGACQACHGTIDPLGFGLENYDAAGGYRRTRKPKDILWKDRKSTRLNSSHLVISYAVFCLKKKKNKSPQLRSRCLSKPPRRLRFYRLRSSPPSAPH